MPDEITTPKKSFWYNSSKSYQLDGLNARPRPANRLGARSTRFVGIEIETIPPRLGDSREFYRELNSLDDSVGYGSDAGGIEIRTPVKGGKDLNKYVTSVVSLLKKNSFSVNNACGLHIHLDLNKDFLEEGELEVTKLAYLTSIYGEIETWIYEYAVSSYRSSPQCHWCKPIKEYVRSSSFKEILSNAEEANDEKLMKIEEHSISANRLGFNLSCAIDKCAGDDNKHIELRYHEGTIKRRDILNWVELNTSVVDTVSKIYDSKNGKFILDTIINKLRRIPTAHPMSQVLTEDLGVRKKVVNFYLKQNKNSCAVSSLL